MKLGQYDPYYVVQETDIFFENSKDTLLYKLKEFPNTVEIVDLVYQIKGLCLVYIMVYKAY